MVRFLSARKLDMVPGDFFHMLVPVSHRPGFYSGFRLIIIEKHTTSVRPRTLQVVSGHRAPYSRDLGLSTQVSHDRLAWRVYRCWLIVPKRVPDVLTS